LTINQESVKKGFLDFDDWIQKSAEMNEAKRMEKSTPTELKKKKPKKSTPEELSEEDEKATLKTRLTALGLKIEEVDGDGNCQFKAISHQIFGNQHHHQALRMMAVAWLSGHPKEVHFPSLFVLFVVFDSLKEFIVLKEGETKKQGWQQYLSQMAKDGEWGDHFTLQALSATCWLKIIVVSSLRGEKYITALEPDHTPEDRPFLTVCLGHLHERHFVSCSNI